jgi:drug/metabolite transporter (DMT)-like permease
MRDVLLVSLASAALFAFGNSLQHLVASKLDDHQDLPVAKLILVLVRRKLWVAGALISGAAFATHVLALSLGNVGVVQALLLSGVVMAILMRPVLEGHRPRLRSVVIALATMSGLALYVASGAISQQIARQGVLPESAMAALVAVAAALVVSATVRRRGPVSAIALAATSGTLMGTGAMLMKSLLVAAPSIPEALTDWRAYGVVAFGLIGTALNQKAYSIGSLPATMPSLNVASVLIGGLAGALVFGEVPRYDLNGVLGQIVGLGIVAAGLTLGATEEVRRQRASEPVSLAV